MDKAGTTPGQSMKKTEGNETGEVTEKVKKKNKQREVSPVASDLTPARRLRAGKEIEGSDKKSAKRGRKRKGSFSKDEEEEEPPAKKENLEKTPLKSLSQSSPTKSPAGVNRR